MPCGSAIVLTPPSIIPRCLALCNKQKCVCRQRHGLGFCTISCIGGLAPGCTWPLVCRYLCWAAKRDANLWGLSTNAWLRWTIPTSASRVGPAGLAWSKAPTSWSLTSASKALACLGLLTTSTPCSLSARGSVTTGGRKGGRQGKRIWGSNCTNVAWLVLCNAKRTR